jgi:hypothetical protein
LRDYGIPGARRIYANQNFGDPSRPAQLAFIAYATSLTGKADSLFNATVDDLPAGSMIVDAHLPGDRYATYYTEDQGGASYQYIFRVNRTVGVWSARGKLTNIMGDQTLARIYDDLAARASGGPTGRVMQFVPGREQD